MTWMIWGYPHFRKPLFEQSRKLKLREKGINKFGKVPPLTKHLCKNDVWQIWGDRLKGNDVCARVWHNYNLQRRYRHRDLRRSHRLPHFCTISEYELPSLTCFLLPIAGVVAWMRKNKYVLRGEHRFTKYWNANRRGTRVWTHTHFSCNVGPRVCWNGWEICYLESIVDISSNYLYS